MKRFLLIALAFSSVLALFPAFPAHASSVYDSVIKNGGSPVLTNAYNVGQGSCRTTPQTLDITTLYMQMINDPSYWVNTTNQSIISSELGDIISGETDGAWALVQYTSSDGYNPGSPYGVTDGCAGHQWVNLYYSNNSSASFVDWYGSHGLQIAGAWGMVSFDLRAIQPVPDGAFGVAYSTTGTGAAANSFIQGDWYTSSTEQMILSTFDIVYPSGYEGVVPPDSISPPVTATDYSPQVIINVANRDITLVFCSSESNARCNIPPALGSGIGVQWAIVKHGSTDPDDVIDSGQGLLRDSTFVHTKVVEYGSYDLVSNYYVPIPFIQPETERYNAFRMQFAVDGSTYATDTEHQNCTSTGGVCDDYSPYSDCFTTTSPWVNLDACWHNIGVLGNTLGFGSVGSLLDVGSFTTCHELGTLGDWLGLDDRTVCAQIPPGVRTVVTPFISLALAMILLGYLVKRGRGVDM